MTEQDIEKLLAERHKEDIFVPQCKNGPTHSAIRLLRLDAWAMARSWENPKLTAYEIKVDRGDFLRDEKWRMAMDYCNCFYWVAPAGIIDPAEIAPECGLMVVTKGCSRLLTKKKALYRDIAPPVSLLNYVLMCRWRPKNECEPQTAAETWRAWLAQKDAQKNLGYNVSRKIRQIVTDRIDAVHRENQDLRFALERLEGAAKILEELGLGHMKDTERGPYFCAMSYNLRGRLNEACSAVPEGLVNKLRAAADALDRLQARCGQDTEVPL